MMTRKGREKRRRGRVRRSFGSGRKKKKKKTPETSNLEKRGPERPDAWGLDRAGDRRSAVPDSHAFERILKFSEGRLEEG